MPRRQFKVIDHTTGKTYPSVAEANRAMFLSNGALGYHKTRKGNRFTFQGHDLELIPDKYVGNIEIRCLETGKVYPSYKEAAEAIGVNPVYMSCHMRGLKESLKGMHFERMDR